MSDVHNWLAATSGKKTDTKKKASLDYSKFDSILDSDDEDDAGADAVRQAQAALPPQLRQNLAMAQAAAATGDRRAAQEASARLAAEMQSAPPEFQEAMQMAKAARAPAASSSSPKKAKSKKKKAAAAARAAAPDELALGAKLEAQLANLEQMQATLAAAADDPEALARLMASAGISEAEMAAVDGDDAAMHALAEQMMARTVGDAGAGVETSMSEVESLVREVESLQKTQAEVLREDGPSSSSSSSSSSGRPSVGVEEMAAKLAEQKRRMDAVAKEVETQRAAAAAAEAQVAAAAAALKEAEAKKEEQGRRVDASLEDAKAEVAGQLSAHREAVRALEGQVATMKERGNTAMRAGDRTAALGFYSEAIRIATDGGGGGGGGLALFGPDGAPSGDSAAAVAISPAEVAKLHANRCACFLALEEPKRALADADAAAALAPDWAKAQYRLGCVRETLGDATGALAALREAARLEPTSEEIAARVARAEEAAAAAQPSGGGGGGLAPAPSESTAAAEAEEDLAAAFAEAMPTEVLKEKADELFAAGDVEAAARKYTVLLERQPHWPQVLANRAACALKLGDFKSCASDCDAALAEGAADGGSADDALPPRLQMKVRMRRAEARRRLGAAAAAADDLRVALQLARRDTGPATVQAIERLLAEAEAAK